MKRTILTFITIAIIGFFMNDLVAQSAVTSNIKVLSESSFKAETKSGLVLVDFYADWCRPCKMMKPVLEEVAGEYKSQIKIASINTDFNKTLSSQYNISGIPCMILFKDGKEVKRIIGYQDKTQLLAQLNGYVK